MALTNENGNGMVMPVQPLGNGYGYGGYGVPYPVGGYGNSFGFGGGFGDLLVLFLFAAMFGMGGFGGFGGGFGDGMFPWLIAGQAGINTNTNNGFDNAALSAQLSGIQSSLTTGFSNAEVANCNRAMDALNASYTNQIASLNRSFDAQTAVTAGQTALASQFADCCCENRLASANLSALVQSENCADRAALSDGIRDVIASQTAGTQRILDKLCDQELAAERRENDQLRQQLNMANLAASQTAQTARLLADNAAQTQQIENYVRPQINPAYIVPNPYAYNFYPNGGWGNTCGCGFGA